MSEPAAAPAVPPGGTRPSSVLVTGATTPIGRQVCHILYRKMQFRKIIAVARDESPYYFSDYNPERFVYKQANILKTRQLANLFLSDTLRKARVDTVVHLAFLTPASKREGDHPEMSVEGTKNILDRCLEDGGIRKFIFQSGSLVYKLKPWNSVLIDEESELNFDVDADPWTKARVDADMLCRAKMDSAHMKIVVLRPSPIIGRNIASHLNDLLSGYVVFRIAGWDPMVRPIHSNDVLSAIVTAVEKDVKGVFNIAGRDIAPLSEFVHLAGGFSLALPFFLTRRLNAVQRFFGLTDVNLSYAPKWLKFACVLDIAKAQRVLGFEPEHHVKFAAGRE